MFCCEMCKAIRQQFFFFLLFFFKPIGLESSAKTSRYPHGLDKSASKEGTQSESDEGERDR